MKLLLQFASGPLAFVLLYAIPFEGATRPARIALAVFGWMIAWWMTQPVPWGVTSLLPLVLFPVLRLLPIDRTVVLYGQTIFFWIWGTVLMGYALDRHGLARRFALWFMSLPAVGASSNRLAFAFMLVTGLVSMFISDAATVAMMMPVCVSLVSFARNVTGISSAERSNFGGFLALGALYGAVAGGTATMVGLPHNKLSLDLLEKFTGRAFGWFEWMKAGVPIFLVALIAFFIILRLFMPPEFSRIPGGNEFLQQERDKLGTLSGAQRATLFIFAMMVLMFTLPTILQFTLGPEHPVTRWSATGLSANVVPPTVILLLFCTPVNWRKGEFVLGWRDALAHTPWDIMLLTASATGVVGVLVDLGLVKSLGAVVGSLGLDRLSLPFVSAGVVALVTNFMSGTAATSLFGSILIPAAQQVGWNPASMAMLIPNVALGIAMPWAGAAAGTAFASGEIEMKTMIRIGLVATFVFAFLVAVIHLLLAPVL